MNYSEYILPVVAAIVGIILAFWMQGDISFTTFVSGLVYGFGATGIDQFVSIPSKVSDSTQN